ncbi:MAG: HD domain-containing protein [Flavobacteriaceae bacterium]|nr:HD domain-containing protein [Flavobacteriaceae bacterium]MBT4313772.1 HD domain-containing protein [Flavobacteriaceae bacterium]MBT5091758.1 HD domain-containing protein [Flavobacteriaceae bacterium]MBT5283288.1 HD domain-containing protein [Flavobacteriaceae bacterium]MBT5446710.1 HD domain-containing protein [Flavobacteriaceae bacterium]
MKLQKDFSKVLATPLFEVLQQTVAESNTLGYVIGGFVRDHLLNRSHKKDIDIVALDSGIDLAIAVQNKLKGAKAVQVFKTYGTAMVHWNNTDLEFVGARKESYSKESRNPEVKPGTLEDDQNRRDFTINALAISLNKDDFGLLIDPFNGLKDLEEGVLRTPLDPDITYSDDPLRMLRAIRFATQLDFTIASDSYDSISRNAERIDIITKERIVEELNKILMTPKPSKGFILLEKTGLLQRILPELIDLKGVEEIEGQKHKDNFYHTLEVVDNLCKNSDDLWLRWAALLHDIGKAPTKKFKPPVGWTFHNHEFVGAKMTYNLFKRMKMPLNEKMKFVQKMVFMSSRPIIIAEEQVTDSAIRRLVFDAGPFIDDLITLCEADITTKNPERFERYHNNFKIVREKIILVEEKDHLRNFQPPISGETIMKYFDLKPSKEIGLIKEAIKEAILEGEIPNEREAALKKMKSEGKKLGLTFHEKAI